MPYRPSARRLNEWVKVGKRGKVHTYTVAYINVDGTKLKKVIIWAMVKIDSVHGGFMRSWVKWVQKMWKSECVWRLFSKRIKTV